MASSRLRLNASNIELIWLGAAWNVRLCPVDTQLISSALITPPLEVRDRGVVDDSDVLLKSHVYHVASVGCSTFGSCDSLVAR
jgi:hypothetical protein